MLSGDVPYHTHTAYTGKDVNLHICWHEGVNNITYEIFFYDFFWYEIHPTYSLTLRYVRTTYMNTPFLEKYYPSHHMSHKKTK